jgi:molybdopterin-binding protein
VTHDRDEAARLGDRVAVLAEGRVRQVGATAEVFSAPADETVAAYVGVETVAEGRVVEVEEGLVVLEVGSRQVEAAAADFTAAEALVCLRPEDVVLSLSGREVPSSARNHLQGNVRRLTPGRAEVLVEVDCGFRLVASITRRSLEEMSLAVGTPVVASFKATAVHLIPRLGERRP